MAVSYTHLDVYKRQLQTLVIALGAGLGIWGAINLLEGCLLYTSEDRSRKCPKKKTEPAKKDGEHHAGIQG